MDIVNDTYDLAKKFVNIYGRKAEEKGLVILDNLLSMNCEQVCYLRNLLVEKSIKTAGASMVFTHYERNCSGKGR